MMLARRCLGILAVAGVLLCAARHYAIAQIVQSGGGGGIGGCTSALWANLPASPAAGTCFYVSNAASCAAGTQVTTSGSTPCTLSFINGGWYPAGGATSAASGGFNGTGTGLTSAGQTVSLVTPVGVTNGGTGASSAGATAANNIGAAALGANSDITSLSGLTTPLSVAQGGTGATSGSATAASNVGALAKSNNLNDVASASTSRTNLGLGSIATVNSPVPVANGGTGTTSAGATAAGNIGALAVSSNLSDLNSASTARTNLGLGAAATLGVGSGLTSTGGNITLTAPVTAALGGTACPQTSTLLFSQLPATPALNTTCTITDANPGACVSGATITSGTGVPSLSTGVCQLTYLGATLGWVSGGASAASSGSGTVNAGTLGNEAVYSGTTSVGPVSYVIHAGTSTLAAAMAAVPQTTWASSTHYTQGALIYDGTNTQRVADWEPGRTYSNGQYIIPGFGNAGGLLMKVTSASTCTSGTTVPSFNQTPTNTTTDNTCTWTTQSTAYCASGGSTPSWSTSLNGNTVDSTCNWTMAYKGAAAPSVSSVIVADPGQTYNIATPIFVGETSVGQTLLIDSSNIHSTNTGGAGQAGIVFGNYGKIVGRSRLTSSITADSSASIDSLLESTTDYLYSALGVAYQQVNADVSHISLSAGSATIGKSTMWLSGIDGDGIFNDIYFNPPSGATTQLIVEDAPKGSAIQNMFWNALNFNQVWIGMGSATTGADIECGVTAGSSGSNLIWTGGGVVDPVSNSVTFMKVNGGSNANCRSIKISAPYLEGLGSSATQLLINDTNDLTADRVYCNVGSQTNCVKITGVESGLSITGYNANSTNAVNDTGYGYVNTSQGQFTYDPPVNGANLLTSSTNASGSTTVTISPLEQKFILTGNATLNLARGAGGSDSYFSTAGAPTIFGLEVCQDGTGGRTLAFGTGSNVTNVYFSGGTQPSYTTTLNHGDFYACQYNGTNVYCRETISDVPCA